MPTIIQIGSVYIRMFFNDHNPPHFHIVTLAGEAVLVRISDFSLLAGKMNRKDLDTGLNWAMQNKGLLEDEWQKFNGA